MKNFFRSLKYLIPYKKRLIVAAICVIFIATLWSGGIGMALPALKVLMSPDGEGLHGWAWDSMAEDRMKATLTVRDSNFQDTSISSTVIDIMRVNDAGPAAKAGIQKNWWIVGYSPVVDGSCEKLRGDLLLKELAYYGQKPCKLELFDPINRTTKIVTVDFNELTIGSKVLAKAASLFKKPEEPEDRMPILISILAIVVIMTLLRNLLRFIQEYLVQTAVFRGIMDLRCENFNVSLHLPVTFFSQRGTSDTMSRFIQDCGELARGQNTLFGKTLVEPAKAIGSIVGAFLLLPKFTIIGAIAAPPVVIMIRLLGKKMKRASKKSLQSYSSMLGVLEETLTGIRVVKTYTMEAGERKRFYRVNRKLYKQQKKMAKIDSSTAPIVEAFGITAGMVAAGAAGWAVFSGELDQFVFMTWMAMLAAIFDPIRKLSKVATRFQRADAAAERIFELHDSEQETRSPTLPQLPRHKDSIKFDNVSYTYPGASQPALQNITCSFQAGQTVAIVGANGCGKTTMVSLLPRLLEVCSGCITIDGCDISKHSIRSLRRQIGVVTQDTVMFNATIGENIAYGLRRPAHDKVLAAAKQAFVDEFVQELPEGYDTMVGQHGATLSGGQKQRISIARAILRDPSILIFDEALSQIDPDSEQKIYKATDEFIKGRTTFMIAHRFSTILNADSIIVMDAGKIIDIARHDVLMERCEIYRHLYNTQFAPEK